MKSLLLLMTFLMSLSAIAQYDWDSIEMGEIWAKPLDPMRNRYAYQFSPKIFGKNINSTIKLIDPALFELLRPNADYNEYRQLSLDQAFARTLLAKILDYELVKNEESLIVDDSFTHYAMRTILIHYAVGAGLLKKGDDSLKYGNQQLFDGLKEAVGEKDVRFFIDWKYCEYQLKWTCMHLDDLRRKTHVSMEPVEIFMEKMPQDIDGFHKVIAETVQEKFSKARRQFKLSQLNQIHSPIFLDYADDIISYNEVKNVYEHIKDKQFVIKKRKLIGKAYKLKFSSKEDEKNYNQTINELRVKADKDLAVVGDNPQDWIKRRFEYVKQLNTLLEELAIQYNLTKEDINIEARADFSAQEVKNINEALFRVVKDGQVEGNLPTKKFKFKDEIYIASFELKNVDSNEYYPLSETAVADTVREIVRNKYELAALRNTAYQLFKKYKFLKLWNTCVIDNFPCNQDDEAKLTRTLFDELTFTGKPSKIDDPFRLKDIINIDAKQVYKVFDIKY